MSICLRRNKVIYPPRSLEGWNDRRRRRSRKIVPDHVPESFLTSASLACPFALSLSFSLTETSTPHPSTSRHITFLPTASLPIYQTTDPPERRGKAICRSRRCVSYAAPPSMIYVMCSHLSSYVFSVELWMKIIVRRDAHDFYCQRIVEILQLRESVWICHLIASLLRV